MLKEGLKFSWPFVPTLMIAWIMNWSDQLFIANFLSMAEVGIYSMSYKVSMSFNMLIAAAAITFTPFFYETANSEDQEKAKSILCNVIIKIVYGYMLVAFLIAIFSFEIVTIFLTDQYNQAITLIRILIISHLLSAIMGVSTNLFYLQAKKSKLQLSVVIFGAIVNILLNFLLIPTYGLFGAAFATVASMFILTIIHYNVSRKCYFVKLPWIGFAKFAVMLGATVFFVSVLGENIIVKVSLCLILSYFVWRERAWWVGELKVLSNGQETNP
jgi:O-antigen/teichoic acid export membrane protein